MLHFESHKLKAWFQSEKRDLPWRENPDPYAVWISEVMLQQTQVSVVIPYFERWMSLFPTIETLASSPIETVIKCWEGLGYYSRARRLHEAAQYLVEHCGGKLPETQEALSKIKGLGPYTIGAIRSFAFHHKTPAVDGNVIRVLSRHFAIQEDVGKSATLKKIFDYAESILPEDEPWVVNEALIELGATICVKRKPKCSICPLKRHCKGSSQGIAESLPYKSAKIKIENLFRAVAVIENEGKFLVCKAPKGKIMSGLQEFPYFSCSPTGGCSASLKKQLLESFQLNVHGKIQLPEVSHSFTRFRAKLFPYYFTASKALEIDGFQWLKEEDLDNLAFSSGHKKIYQQIKNLKTQ